MAYYVSLTGDLHDLIPRVYLKLLSLTIYRYGYCMLVPFYTVSDLNFENSKPSGFKGIFILLWDSCTDENDAAMSRKLLTEFPDLCCL